VTTPSDFPRFYPGRPDWWIESFFAELQLTEDRWFSRWRSSRATRRSSTTCRLRIEPTLRGLPRAACSARLSRRQYGTSSADKPPAAQKGTRLRYWTCTPSSSPVGSSSTTRRHRVSSSNAEASAREVSGALAEHPGTHPPNYELEAPPTLGSDRRLASGWAAPGAPRLYPPHMHMRGGGPRVCTGNDRTIPHQHDLHPQLCRTNHLPDVHWHITTSTATRSGAAAARTDGAGTYRHPRHTARRQRATPIRTFGRLRRAQRRQTCLQCGLDMFTWTTPNISFLSRSASDTARRPKRRRSRRNIVRRLAAPVPQAGCIRAPFPVLAVRSV